MVLNAGLQSLCVRFAISNPTDLLARVTVAPLSTCGVPGGRYTQGDRKLFQFWPLQLIIMYNWKCYCLEEKLSA